MSAARKRPAKGRPIEYSILYTATLCMLAEGAVMVYSASSAESLLTTGDAAYFLKRYVIFGLLGLGLMHYLSRHGLKAVKQATPILLIGSFVLCVAGVLPGGGGAVNGATRWLRAGAPPVPPPGLPQPSPS